MKVYKNSNNKILFQVVVHALILASDDIAAADEFKPDGISISVGSQLPEIGSKYIGKLINLKIITIFQLFYKYLNIFDDIFVIQVGRNVSLTFRLLKRQKPMSARKQFMEIEL